MNGNGAQARRRYTLSNCAYLSSNALALNFSTAYLQARGMSGTQIGAAFSLAALGSMVVDLGLSAIVDSRMGITSRHVLMACNAAMVALALAMPAVGSAAGIMLVFVGVYGAVLSMQQFSNALAMDILNSGIPINFGIARGLGSVAHIVVTLAMGQLIAARGETRLPWAIAAAGVLSIVAVWRVPPVADSASRRKPPRGGYLTLLREDRRIALMLAGVMLVSIFTSCVSCFMLMIVQNLGGDSRTLSYLLGFGTFCEVPLFLLYSRIALRFSSKEILLFSTVVYFIRCMLYNAARSMTAMFIAQLLQGFSYSLFFTSGVVFMNEVTSEANKARGQALLSMVSMCVGSVFSSAAGGVLLDTVGVRGMLVFNGVCVFCGVLCVSRALLPDILRERRHAGKAGCE